MPMLPKPKTSRQLSPEVLDFMRSLETPKTGRQCGDCNLCCKLLPVSDNEPWRKGEPINKPAGVPCPHQRHRKGCAIYHTAMPFCCKAWNCRWLVNDDTADLPRPDRAHYVIDVMPDYVTLQHNETGETQNIQVVQVWIDPSYPDAHRDPAFRRYLERRGAEGTAAVVRFNSKDAITIFPPSLVSDGQWHEVTGGVREGEHSLADVERALGSKATMVHTKVKLPQR